jgi:hypothetical protein
MLRTVVFAAVVGVLSVITADAQSDNPPVIIGRRDPPVRVQVNLNLFVPGPTGEGEDANKLRDQTQRSFYAIASHECDLLREVLAKDCRLDSLNVNLNGNRAFGQQGQMEGYTVQGQMSFQITLK